jgi:uroporphyrinogen-III synthase
MSEKTYGLFPAKSKEKFIGELEKNGANIVLFPAFATEKIAFNQSFIEHLQNFDWIIFTDVFAADIFVEMLKETDFDLYEFDNFRVLAAGEAVADRLRFEQIHSDIIPTKLSAEPMFQAIADYEINLKDVKFLVLKESEREVELIENLKNADAEVTERAVYKLNFETDSPKLKALIKGGAIDKIVFASPEEIVALQKIFAPESLSEVLNEIEVSAIDEVTRKSLWENGL